MARRDKNIAKIEIYGAFRNFIQSGQTKVTVSAVIEATGMNRKTFYNHFANQDELVAWGFRRDLHEMLLRRFPESELLDPPNDPYGFQGLPCYTRTPARILALDQTQCLCCLRDVFSENKDYYRTLMRTEFAGPLRQYLVTIYQGLFCEDVDYFLSGRKMPEQDKRFIATIYAEGVVHYMADSFMGLVDQRNLKGGEGIVGNVAHEGMLAIVEAQQNEKSHSYFMGRR